jgi:hypothetical protein
LSSLAPLARTEDGAVWARRRFAARRGLDADAFSTDRETDFGAAENRSTLARRIAVTLPRTNAWLVKATNAAHRLDARIPNEAFEAPSPFRPSSRAGSPVRGADANVERRNLGISSAPVAMRSGTAFPTRSREGDGQWNASGAGGAGAQRASSDSAPRVSRETSSVTAHATRATTPEGLVRVALVGLVAGNDDDFENGRENGFPETLEFDVARVWKLRDAFVKLKRRAAVFLLSGNAIGGSKGFEARGGLSAKERHARLDALLADPATSFENLAVEIVRCRGSAETARFEPHAKPYEISEGSDVGHGHARVSAISETLERLASSTDPAGLRLHRALRDALGARALLGPTKYAQAAAAAAARAAAAAAPLLRAGFAGEEGTAIARAIASLAARIDATIGRVTWNVHGPFYRALAANAFEADDEI